MGLRTFRGLNACIPWNEILTAIGYPCENNYSFPVRTRCPLCDGANLVIYKDNISSGTWHYCFSCGSAGDTIELAAKYWQVPPSVAVRRLAKADCPVPEEQLTVEALTAYTEDYVDYRMRFKAFFKKAGKYLPKANSRVLRSLLTKYRIHSVLSSARIDANLSHMIGAAHYAEVERMFAVNQERAQNLQTGKVSAFVSKKLFSGFTIGKWTDVLVVPFNDLPGRVCNVLFVGRDGTPEDHVYRHLDLKGKNVKGQCREGGLACYWALENSKAMFSNHIVVTGDPFLALRLHARYFAVANVALPLVAYCDTPQYRTQKVWEALDTRVPVFWGWQLTPSLVYQAICANGKIHLTDMGGSITQARIDHYIRDNDPRGLVRQIIRHSKPWREFLCDWGNNKAQNGALEALLLGLEVYKVDRELLASISYRIRSLLRPPVKNKEFVIDKKRIVERNGKWWLVDNETTHLVMNALLRIDATCVRSGVSYYRGRLIYERKTINFELPTESLIQKPFVALTALLAEHAPGAVLFVEPRWLSKLVPAATAFAGAI